MFCGSTDWNDSEHCLTCVNALLHVYYFTGVACLIERPLLTVQVRTPVRMCFL